MALVRTRRIIDDAGASAVIAAAEQKANAHGHRVVIAVVDPHGELIELRRTPGADRLVASRSTRPAPRQSSCGRAARWRSRYERPARRARAPRRLRALTAASRCGWTARSWARSARAARRRTRTRPSRSPARLPISPWPRSPRSPTRARASRPRRPALQPRSAACAVISAVDAGGALMYLVRPDSAQVASVEVTTDQGAHRRDLPAAEQGLRGPGVRWAAVRRSTSRARCRSRAACRSSRTAW